jgi:membrane protein YqaA with SNARE-associated domain
MKNRYVQFALTLLLFIVMVITAVALWRGVIPIAWLASLGYKGIFFLSLINGIAPVGGPSQLATFFIASKLDPLAVGLLAGIGGAIGEVAGYAFGYFLRAAQSPKVERKIERLANWRVLRISREHSFIPLFVLASIPNPFFDPASALAGSLRIGFAQYFIPVLLGKTVRHLAIAYAGYYTFSANIAPAFDQTLMAGLVSSGWLIVAVLGIALFSWFLRSYAEGDADPFLVNFTFFAFAGQCIKTGELIIEGTPRPLIFGLFLVAIILVAFQVFVIRAQVWRTIEHYKEILEKNKIANCTSDEIGRWATVLVRITGVDFYPEFYKWLNEVFGSEQREKRRNEAVSILPRDRFNCEENGVTSDSLTVPPERRKVLWRFYAYVCLLSWLVFVSCLLVPKHP